MDLRRSSRRWLSFWIVASLLFTQWATAAYVCPRTALPTQQASMPCDGTMVPGLDPAQPNLCKVHGESGAQSSGNTPVFDLPAAASTPVLARLAWWPASTDASLGVEVAATSPPPGWPPLYLTLGVLRN